MVTRAGRTSACAAAALAMLAAVACRGGGSAVTSPTATTPAPLAAGPSVPASTPAPVPDKYRALYDQLNQRLDAYQAAVDAMRDGGSGVPPVAGVELLAANGNRLSALLQPSTMTYVDESLDRFRALGIGGVTLGIKVPMLLPELGPDGDRYSDFFAAVADHARARDMKVSVELGALFCNTPLAGCSYRFAGGYDSFVAMTAAQARIVIQRIHPDYLTILAEPDTEARLTGIASLATPAGAARYVGDVLAAIPDRGTTKIGAGSGTWMPTTFDSAIIQQPIDYLDAHVYPVGAGPAANAVAVAGLAKQAGKPLVIDEVWLYKTVSLQPGADGVAAAADIFRLDAFSFWEPLDARFLALTAEWARKGGASYVSAFWSWQMFGYLAWTPQLDAAPFATLTAAFNQAAVGAMMAGRTTTVGQQWAAGQ